MWVKAYKLPGKNTAGVDVARVWLEAFVVPENLRCTCSGHWGNKKTVTHSVLCDASAKTHPVVVGDRGDVPHVWLEDSLAYRAAFVGFVRAMLLCQLARGLECREVDRLEDLTIQLRSMIALIWEPHEQ